MKAFVIKDERKDRATDAHAQGQTFEHLLGNGAATLQDTQLCDLFERMCNQ
jgi:hypothetical protein